MEYEPLERLLLETKISNCQRSLAHCPESHRGLLIAMLNEARQELDDLREREALTSATAASAQSGSALQDQP